RGEATGGTSVSPQSRRRRGGRRDLDRRIAAPPGKRLSRLRELCLFPAAEKRVDQEFREGRGCLDADDLLLARGLAPACTTRKSRRGTNQRRGAQIFCSQFSSSNPTLTCDFLSQRKPRNLC